MSLRVCVDASLALKLVLDEEDSDRAHALWQAWVSADTEIVAPEYLAVEATSVIRNHVYRGLLSKEAGQAAFDALHAQAITLISSQGLNSRAWELSEQFGRPTAYDAYYMVVAETFGCDLWTADRRFVKAVRDTVSWVKWLGDEPHPGDKKLGLDNRTKAK